MLVHKSCIKVVVFFLQKKHSMYRDRIDTCRQLLQCYIRSWPLTASELEGSQGRNQRGDMGACPPVAVGQFFTAPLVFCRVSIFQQIQFYQTSHVLVVCLFFLSTCLRFLGALPPEPCRSCAPGSRWGTSAPDPLVCPPPLVNSWLRPGGSVNK